MRMEEFSKCLICGAIGDMVYKGLPDRLFGVAGLFNLRYCSSCRLWWLSPRPIVEDIAQCYKNYFTMMLSALDQKRFFPKIKDIIRESILCGYYGYRHLHRKHLLCKWGKLLGANPILRTKATYYLAESFPPPPKASDDLLVDIGCGRGGYLEIMQKLGWKVLGIEPDPTAAAIAQDKGITVIKGTLEGAGLAETSVVQITMNHVFEHLPDPLSTLTECFKVLKTGGRLVIRTPNADSLSHKVFDKHCLFLDPPRHLFVFSPQSMRLILKKIPFEKVYIRTLTTSAKFVYDNSVLILKKGKIDFKKARPPQKGRYGFALKEWLLCRFGKEYGEEVEAVAIK